MKGCDLVVDCKGKPRVARSLSSVFPCVPSFQVQDSEGGSYEIMEIEEDQLLYTKQGDLMFLNFYFYFLRGIEF